MMALPETYLKYPHRQHGQDIDRYAWRAVEEKEKKSLPGNAALAIAVIVPIEYFMLNPSGKPFKHPGAMATPYPDLRHYTTRDYGNRVGAFRLLSAFKAAGVKATFAVNAALLDRIGPLMDAIGEDGHEIAAHGWDTDSIHWGGIEQDVEKRYVEKTRTAFDKAGLTPRSWMSPARQQSFETLDLIKDAGFDICLDWEHDATPSTISTKSGPIRAFPVLNELDDRFILTTKNHSEADWRDQILEAALMTKSESARRGAQCFGFAMTPYIAGLPFRMWAIREILETLSRDKALMLDSVSSLTDHLS